MPHPDPTASTLESYHDFATQLAVRAGTLLCQSVSSRASEGYLFPHAPSTHPPPSTQPLNTRDKASNVDVVTDTDIAVERFIIDAIRSRFPDHSILAEETYAAGGKSTFDLGDEPTWIVDPLDGTVNYVHLFPLICVSIGLTINRVPVVGAIYAPLLGGFDVAASRGTLWSSCTGGGAFQSFPHPLHPSLSTLHWLQTHAGRPPTSPPSSFTSPTATAPTAPPPPFPDGTVPRPLRLPLGPLRPLPPSAPTGLLIASEWGKDRRPSPTSNLHRKAHTFVRLAALPGGAAHGLRSLGSAALDLAYCASGSLDVVWEGGCWEWDVCAGLAILVEAGGIVTDANAPGPEARWWNEEGERVPSVSVGARRFLCVRACADGEGEGAEVAQRRVVRAIWSAVELGGLEYRREGVEYPV